MNKCSADPQPIIYYPTYQKNNFPYYSHQIPLRVFSPQISHIPNIFCFHNCSIWSLAIKSTYNKKTHPQGPFYGKISNAPNPINISLMQLPTNLMEFFPVDLLANQRFVLDQSQPKENLNLLFDFSGISNNFTNINMNYANIIFDFSIYANLHGINAVKDPINFKVKGYDILKSIQNKLSEINYFQNFDVKTSENKEYMVTVFQNIQCTFIVEFTVSNVNIAKYITSSQQSMNYNISLCDIRISKLNINYCLPLNIFLYRPIKRPQPLFYINPYHQFQQFQQYQQMMLFKNLCRSYTPIKKTNKSKTNFCNWHSFMTSTTPFIFETDKIYIKDILNSFRVPSLFGARCTFKFSNSSYSQVNYFPSISSISLIIQEQNYNNNRGIQTIIQGGNSNGRNSLNCLAQNLPAPSLSLAPTKSLQPQKEPLSLNGSFQTNVSESALLNQSNLSSSNLRTIYYKEQSNEIYNIKNLNQQLRDIIKNEPDLENLILDDLGKESWFSIIWTPSQTFQPQKIKEGVTFEKGGNFPIFKVFYQFKQGPASNVGKFITVIGIMEKTIKGKNININSQTDSFWFRNNNNLNDEEHFDYNKELFYSLVEQAKLIEL